MPGGGCLHAYYAWLPTWVEPEHIAWAVHCALGSALHAAKLPIWLAETETEACWAAQGLYVCM